MFRFTIREMFLVVVIVALCVGWGLDHQRIAGELATAKRWQYAAGAAEHALNNLGFKTEWDLKWDTLYVSDRGRSRGFRITDNEPSEPISK